MISRWDPRLPNINKIFNANMHFLHANDKNKSIFPVGSLFCGFRRNKNLGEIICPTIPVRTPPPEIDRSQWGCHPSKCTNPRRCDLCDNYLEETKTIKSLADGRTWQIRCDVNCKTSNVIYVIECLPCGKQYVGSSINFQRRWYNHKHSIEHKKDKESGIAMHFTKVAHNDWKNCIKVTIIDTCQQEKFLKDREDFWIVNLNTLHSERGLNTRDEIKRKSRIPRS